MSSPPSGRRADVGEDVAPALEEQLMRSLDDSELCVRQSLRVRLADRGRADDVGIAPPQGHGRPHVGHVEAPWPAEVRELAGEPDAAVLERLHAPPRVRLVGARVARRRYRLPPPLLQAPPD